MRSTPYLTLLAGVLLIGSAQGTPIRGPDSNAASHRRHDGAALAARSDAVSAVAKRSGIALSPRERSAHQRRGTKGRRCIRRAQSTLAAPPSTTSKDDTLIGDWLDGLLPNASVSVPGLGVCVGAECAPSTPPPVAQPTQSAPAPAPAPSSSCFPALDFKMPSDVPGSLDNWWCAPKTEYAFVSGMERMGRRLRLTLDFTDGLLLRPLQLSFSQDTSYRLPAVSIQTRLSIQQLLLTSSLPSIAGNAASSTHATSACTPAVTAKASTMTSSTQPGLLV